MSLKQIPIKKAYSSDDDDILNDFYIPALKASVEYKRIAGFFSSTSLAIAARGIIGLIRNGGTMKLIISPKLNKDDVDMILNYDKNLENYIEKKMLVELEYLEDEFIKDHIFALGWMLANKRMKIKVAIPFDKEGKPLNYKKVQQNALFHQKVGILKDMDGNIVTFSGSINETATGWLENIEEFKVFRNWQSSEDDYIKADISKFNNYWKNQSLNVKIINVPQAVKEELIRIAPNDIKKINLNKWYKKKKVKLFDHQKCAVESWMKNGMNGIFEMATGTGKTYAALGCLDKVSLNSKKLLTIISCPYQHLLQQWKREINKFGLVYDDLIIADSSNPSWKNNLTDLLINIYLGYKNNAIVLTTHRTFSSRDFIKIIQDNKKGFTLFLIGDEVHGLGAKKSREGLTEKYDLRLGLSATPKRWFDTSGTNAIYEYFGGIVYEFDLKNAINTINPVTGETYLTPYRYIPKFVSLTNDELEEYIHKSRNIAKKFNEEVEDVGKDSILEKLMFKRANIIKNATKKYVRLEGILDEIDSFQWMIIYCSPQQIDSVMEIIKSREIVAHRFTMKEGTKPDKKYNDLSKRDFLLQNFGKGKYQTLVAMKCLDEGVDVPAARTAILMASSGNPREYIQRIGRIIRRYPHKKEATIYDIVVTPSLNNLPPEIRKIEEKVFEKELKRYEEIAKIAVNNAEALELIYNIRNRL